MSVRLHINVDHVATLRNARGTPYPSPARAAEECLGAGADGITAHLREDRRHIVDADVERSGALRGAGPNLQPGDGGDRRDGRHRDTREALRMHVVTLVPERREERTTEGGLDVVGEARRWRAPREGAASARGSR